MPGAFYSSGIADSVGNFQVDGFLGLGAVEAVIIATGVIAVTKTNVTVDVETGTTDDLETINGGEFGNLLLLRATSSARTVVVKDGVGNLRIAGDFSMDHANDKLLLIESSGVWEEISRSNNS